MEQTLEQKLAEMGVRQFVRNEMVAVLLEKTGTQANPDTIIAEMNKRLMEKFATISQDESTKVFAELYSLN